ncbi:MAG: hypothetical protein DSZ29_02200 [Aquificaceae bacterium]|nr:MAG: hypothetical protein DSZ29_02200 [Aquificaceae bacterium]
MNKKDKTIQEHELHAYVDNQLDDERVKAVEKWLKNNPHDAQKVFDWQGQNIAINKYFDDEKYQQIPHQFDVKKLSQQNRRYQFQLAASVMMMLFTGLIGWFSHAYYQSESIQIAENYNFVSPAVSAYKVYSVDIKHPVEISADKEKHLVKWLSNRLGKPLSTPQLSSLGYQLVGGRLLAVKQGPAAQFMFENKAGKRITLFISNNPSLQTASFHFTEEQQVKSFYWVDKNLSYALSGDISRQELLALSHLVYQQLEDPLPVNQLDKKLLKEA